MQRLRTDEVGTGDPGFRLRLGRLIDCRGAWDPQGNGPATDRDRRVPSAPSPQGGAGETTGKASGVTGSRVVTPELENWN